MRSINIVLAINELIVISLAKELVSDEMKARASLG